MSLTKWQIATSNLEKKHPKCIGKKCGTYKLCDIGDTGILIFGCIHYDKDAETQMIDDEIAKLE